MLKNHPELGLPIDDWREKAFSNPKKRIRLATDFSGWEIRRGRLCRTS